MYEMYAALNFSTPPFPSFESWLFLFSARRYNYNHNDRESKEILYSSIFIKYNNNSHWLAVRPAFTSLHRQQNRHSVCPVLSLNNILLDPNNSDSSSVSSSCSPRPSDRDSWTDFGSQKHAVRLSIPNLGLARIALIALVSPSVVPLRGCSTTSRQEGS